MGTNFMIWITNQCVSRGSAGERCADNKTSCFCNSHFNRPVAKYGFLVSQIYKKARGAAYVSTLLAYPITVYATTQWQVISDSLLSVPKDNNFILFPGFQLRAAFTIARIQWQMCDTFSFKGELSCCFGQLEARGENGALYLPMIAEFTKCAKILEVNHSWIWLILAWEASLV